MTKISNISCVMIVKNAEATLKDVLDALHAFQEVIIYSNNSTDATDTIAASYKNVKLIRASL